MKMKKNTPFFIVVIILFFWSGFAQAGLGQMSSFHNSEIDSNIKEEIQSLNSSILSSIINNNPEFTYGLLVEEGKKNGLDSISNLYKQLQPVIKENNFTAINEYHVKYKGLGKTTFPIPSKTEPPFYTHLECSNSEYYISIFESSGSFQNFALTFIYEKNNETWLLKILHLGLVRMGGKNAIDWFREGQKLYENDHFVPSALRLSIAMNLLRPAPFIQYKSEKDIKDLTAKNLKNIEKHKFPIPIDLDSKPLVYAVVPQFVKNDLLPLVKYITKFPITDDISIRDEVNKMHPILESIFPGISSYGKHVIYRAFDEIPSDPQKQYKVFGVTIDTAR